MTILANTLYRLLAKKLTGHEKETPSLYINFIHNGADIEIKQGEVVVKMLKKAHNPIIMGSEIFNKQMKIPWLNNFSLRFLTQNTT